MAHLRRRARLLHEVAGDVPEHRRQVELLLVVPTERGAGLLPGDREHRLMVEAGVVEAGDQMRGAGTRGRNADPEPAGELGVGAGHERRHLLMPRLDELEPVAGAGSAPRKPLMPSPG